MRNRDVQAAGQAEMERGKSPAAVRYQAVCSVSREGGYCTYGLQCMESRKGRWVQLDLIEDVSPSRDSVLKLASRFNDLQLSPLHFRDVVMDTIGA